MRPSRYRMFWTTFGALILWAGAAVILAAARAALRWRRAPASAQSALMVAWEFPPCAATGVHLPASFVRHASDAGWKVSVVCGPAPLRPLPAGAELAALVPSDVGVMRVSRWFAHDHQVHFHPAWTVPGIDGGYLAALLMAVTAVMGAGRAPPAVVVASGPRFANFVAARVLADIFGARLLLQYRDEWTVNTPDFVTTTPRDRKEELACLARADLVSFVSDGKRAAYMRAFPGINPGKFITTPNGWEPCFHERARAGTKHLPVPSGAFTLTYTGRYHRSFDRLLASCEALLLRRPDLSHLRLIFVGEQLPANQRLIADFAKRHPNVLIDLPAASPTTAIEVQRESSALLLVNDHSYEGVVPLKTFDYLRSGQPILVFGRTGGAAEIVARLDAGVCVPVGDDDALEAAVTRLMTSNRPWDTPARQSWCARHNRKVLVGEMLEALSALIAAPGSPCQSSRPL